MEPLMSIKSFSKFTGIGQSTLRYYDDIGLFSPTERGENDYRYYTPQQIIAVNFIQVMRYLKVPLRTIKELTKERSPEQLANLLMEQGNQLNTELRRMSELYSLINTYHALIREGVSADVSEIAVRYLPELPIIIGPPNDFKDDTQFYRTFIDFCQEADHQKINLAYPVGGYWSNMSAFLKKPSYPQNFFSLDTGGHECRPAGEYLVGYNRGYYGVVNDLPQRLDAYAKEHELTYKGPVYNIFVLDEVSVHDPEKYILQVSVPISRKRK